MKIKNKSRPNVMLLVTIGLLIMVGIMALVTASVPLSLKYAGNANYYLVHQLLWGLLPGLIFGFLAYKVPIPLLKKFSFPIFLIAYILMLLVFVPALNMSALGASRWIDLGFISFQPSDILKLATIIYLAAILTNEKTKKKFATFVAILALICVALLLQSDMGTLITIFCIAIIMFFCSKTKIKETLLIVSGTSIAFVAMILLAPYRLQRLMSFLNPQSDSLGSGYHISQALIAIGSGGVLGSGLGFSVQKFGFVPQSMSDSVFAIFAEETGFIGSVFLVILFLMFFFLSLNTAKKSGDEFSRLLSIGIGSWIIVQAVINMGAMTAILPLTGIPLPFISYGGSHLIVELVACGLLLNISAGIKHPSLVKKA